MIIPRTKRVLLVFCILITALCGCDRKQELLERNPYNLDLVQTISQYKNLVKLDPGNAMTDLESVIDGIALDIRYATTNNFTHEVIYTAPKAYTRKPVAEALKKVKDSLAKHDIGLKIYDAYRPYAATLKFFEVYPDTNFVANPRYGSRHNRGCAVDITLIELATGKEIPMPSEFDDFSERAHPDYQELSDTVLANRAFLFGVMSHFGFSHYPTEWWHFDYSGWETFKLMDLSFDQLERVL